MAVWRFSPRVEHQPGLAVDELVVGSGGIIRIGEGRPAEDSVDGVGAGDLGRGEVRPCAVHVRLQVEVGMHGPVVVVFVLGQPPELAVLQAADKDLRFDPETVEFASGLGGCLGQVLQGRGHSGQVALQPVTDGRHRTHRREQGLGLGRVVVFLQPLPGGLHALGDGAQLLTAGADGLGCVVERPRVGLGVGDRVRIDQGQVVVADPGLGFGGLEATHEPPPWSPPPSRSRASIFPASPCAVRAISWSPFW